MISTPALWQYSRQFISEFGDGKEIWELDTKISNFENMNEELKNKIEMIRLNLLVFYPMIAVIRA